MSQQQPQSRVAESQPMPVIPGSIHARLMNVMRAVNAITKGRTNTQQDFKYRGVDDVFNELHDHCATAGVMPRIELVDHILTERTTQKGGKVLHHLLRCRICWVAEDGQCTDPVLWIGEAADHGDKGVGKAQQYALKMFLIEHFMIPTDGGTDPDAQSYEFGEPQRTERPGRQAERRPAQRPQAQAARQPDQQTQRPPLQIRDGEEVYQENRRACLALKTLAELNEFRFHGSKHMGAEQIQGLRKLRDDRRRELEQAEQALPVPEHQPPEGSTPTLEQLRQSQLFSALAQVNRERAYEIMQIEKSLTRRVAMLEEALAAAKVSYDEKQARAQPTALAVPNYEDMK